MGGKRKTFLSVVALLGLSCALPYQGLADGPDTVELDSLANLYEAVSFDHAMHVDLTEGNCAKCHHHTTGTPPTEANCLRCHKNSGEADVVACRDCHAEKRFEVKYLADLEANHTLYHVDKPGLKGAYHQNCMGCHTEMGAPTGCQDCHSRNDEGDKFFSAGKYAPKPGKEKAGH